MQEELRKSDYPWDKDDDLQKESARHKQLLDALETLKDQLPILKERIKNAKVCGPGVFGIISPFYTIFRAF